MNQDPDQSGLGEPAGEAAGRDVSSPGQEPRVASSALKPTELPARDFAAPLIAPAGVLIPSVGERRTAPPSSRHDPWEHRRGEPRVFALLWTIFLFTATGITMLAVVARGVPDAGSMRPAARTLLVCVALGIAIVWPLIRLSQRRDEEPVGGTLHDLIVLLVPVQAVIWPQTMWWLARWPLEVVAALGLSLSAWSLVIGGIIVLAYSTSRRSQHPLDQRDLLQRSGWMLLLVLLTIIPAVGAVLGGNEPSVRWWWMLSPVTTVLEIARDRSWTGVAADVQGGHWRFIGLTAAAAVPLWLTGIILVRQRLEVRIGSRNSVSRPGEDQTGGPRGGPSLD